MARPRQVSDEELLASARACFLEHGPGVSTTVIAERVGVSQAAVFKRFPTKNELMVAALRPPEHPPFLGLLERGPDPATSLEDQLTEIGLAISRFLGEIVPCIATLHASGIDKEALFRGYQVPPPIRTQLALAAWFQRAQGLGLVRALPPGDLATAFMGSLHVRAFLQHVGAGAMAAPLDQYVRTVAITFLHGIGEGR